MARRYEFYFIYFAALVRKILFLPRENKIHIFKPRCNVMTTSKRSKCVILRTPLHWGSCICKPILSQYHVTFLRHVLSLDRSELNNRFHNLSYIRKPAVNRKKRQVNKCWTGSQQTPYTTDLKIEASDKAGRYLFRLYDRRRGDRNYIA